jgi:hypothetical protein
MFNLWEGVEQNSKALQKWGAFSHAASFRLAHRAAIALRAFARRCLGVSLAFTARAPIA